MTAAGLAASSTDPCTWTRYAAAARSTVGTGLGFVLNGDGIVCIDIDHCLIDGAVSKWAQWIVDSCPHSYIEISPSGDGLHIWGRGDVIKGRRIKVPGGTVEIYGTGRYITVTRRRHGACSSELTDLSPVLTYLIASSPAA